MKPASSLQWKIKICSSKSIIRPEHTLCTWTQQSGEGFASQYTVSDNTHFPSSKLHFSLIAKTFPWLYSYPRLLPLQQLQKSCTWTLYLWTKVTNTHTELLFSMQDNLDLKWIHSHNSIPWKYALLDYSDFANWQKMSKHLKTGIIHHNMHFKYLLNVLWIEFIYNNSNVLDFHHYIV